METMRSKNNNLKPGFVNLALTLTHRCQMRCRYCAIKAARRDISEGEVRQAVDLLLTAPHKEVELQFFGGEPLLRFDLIRKAVAYAEQRARNTGKSASFLLTTNGLLLDQRKLDYFRKFPFRVLLSMDGTHATQAKNRPLKRNKERCAPGVLTDVLINLQKSKMDFFVNLVYSEKNFKELPDNVAFLVRSGARKIQLSYAIGSGFKEKDARDVYPVLSGIFRSFAGIVFFGRRGEHEPILATPQITVDSDGEIYRGCGLVLEKKYPDFNAFCRVGCLKNSGDYLSLTRTPEEQTEYLLDRKRKLPAVLFNNLTFGLALKELMSKDS